MIKPKALALLCALPVVVVTVLVIGSMLRTRRDAKAVIDELKALSVSSRPNDTFDRFQWRYGRSRFKYSERCTFHFCTYEVDISNNSIARLHLTPYTEMKTWFTVDRGQLVQALVEYRTALKGFPSPVIHVQQGICARGCGVRFDLNPRGTDKQMWNGLVEFNSRATAAERDAALALNVKCFYTIGGCKDITELLPEIWQRTGSDSVTSRLLGRSQRLEETHGSLSPDDF